MSFNKGKFWEDLLEDLADPEFREAFIDTVLMFQGDWHEDRLEEESLDEEMSSLHDVWTDGNGAKWYVHKRNIGCDIDGCAIHNPSYHPLSDAKQLIRTDKYMLIEDICKHGVGHPNPDSASFISKKIGYTSIWVHGCDGCCQETKETCDLWGGCPLPRGHNMGHADIPENHKGSIKSSYETNSQDRGFGRSDRMLRDLYEGMTPDMFGYEGDY